MLTRGLPSVSVLEEPAMDKRHVRGATDGTVKDAEGKTITPQEMLAGRKKDPAKEGQLRDNQSPARLPARSAKNEPPSPF